MKNTLLALLIGFFLISKTFACSCIQTDEPLSKKIEKAFTESDFIIRGKVIDIEISSKTEPFTNPIFYTFEIKKNIKEKITTEVITIISESDAASCGYKFELGKSYLVYARKSPHYSSKTGNKFDFSTGLSDRNQKLSTVDKKELRELKQLKSNHKK